MNRRKRNRRRFRLIVFLLLFTGALVLLRFRYMPFLREAARTRVINVASDRINDAINAQIASMVMAMILVCSRSLSELTSLVAICGLIFHGLTFLSVIVLRRKYPTLERPYKVWLYPFSIILVLIFMLSLIVNTIWQDPVTAALGLIVPLIGLVIYELLFRRRHDALERAKKNLQ